MPQPFIHTGGPAGSVPIDTYDAQFSGPLAKQIPFARRRVERLYVFAQSITTAASTFFTSPFYVDQYNELLVMYSQTGTGGGVPSFTSGITGFSAALQVNDGLNASLSAGNYPANSGFVDFFPATNQPASGNVGTAIGVFLIQPYTNFGDFVRVRITYTAAAVLVSGTGQLTVVVIGKG